MEIQVSNCCIGNQDIVNFFGIHVNNNLNFDYHVNQLCKKASKKLHALARIAKYMDVIKRGTQMKISVSSKFSYCPLICTLHTRKMDHRMNNILKRAFKLVYQDSHDFKFQELLVKDKPVCVHQRNFQLLATEIFKSKTGVSPELMNDVFHFPRPDNLRSNYTLKRKRDRTAYQVLESLSSFAPKLWDLLPNSVKNSASLKEFKTKINT